MNLSNEDNLRLNVLLAQKLKAIKIDESKMVLYGLTQKGEASVTLNPNCNDDKYLKIVRELISSKVMSSSQGYPAYINRWTRLGHQERDADSLTQLLRLGDVEAVVAVVNTPKLPLEVAVNAWWAHPTATNARKLLASKDVVNAPLGRELCEYLLEFLPFEIEHRDMIESVRLCLQGDLMNDEEVDDLWTRSKRKQSYYVGFLHSRANNLPELTPENKNLAVIQTKLKALSEQNHYADLLLRLLSSQGQTYLKTIKKVFEKAVSQDTIVSLFIALSHYHKDCCLSRNVKLYIEDAEKAATDYLQTLVNQDILLVADCLPEYHAKLHSMLVLSQMGEKTLNPIFGLSDALGSVMRKKLKPLTEPLNIHIDNLLS
ncbi:MAG: hypothetical protein ISR69_04150 [Gammaproteobacteria bacterium]|nr:hypothetical protein [Gammaproteobacteria bacterium]